MVPFPLHTPFPWQYLTLDPINSYPHLQLKVAGEPTERPVKLTYPLNGAVGSTHILAVNQMNGKIIHSYTMKDQG